MNIHWLSCKGGRMRNEDAIGKTRERGITLVVVCDGLGGHNGGMLASKITVETILETFKSKPEFSKECLDVCINKARDAVSNRAMEDPDLLEMGSTVVALMIKGRRAIWANVGDSRLYRFNSGELSEVTEDHSLAFLSFAKGDIEYDDIRRSPEQSKLTSTVGLTMSSVNYSNERAINSSTAFLLCTDGWWEYVTEDDMEESYKGSTSGKMWLERMLEIHNKKAPETCDNYTAAVVII